MPHPCMYSRAWLLLACCCVSCSSRTGTELEQHRRDSLIKPAPADLHKKGKKQQKQHRSLSKFRDTLHRAFQRKADKEKRAARDFAKKEQMILNELSRLDDPASLDAVSEDQLFDALFGLDNLKPPPVPGALKYLEKVWPGLDEVQAGLSTSNSEEDKQSEEATGSRSHVVYGELASSSVLRALERAQWRPGERFYDLGSGGGKVVAMAWLLGMRATGVELLSKRFTSACAAVRRLPVAGRPANASSTLSFIRSSFLDVDWCDGDIVYVNAVMFSPQLMSSLAERAACLRRGARMVFVGHKCFDLPHGVPRRATAHWSSPVAVANHSASWGETSVTFQQKVTDRGEQRQPSQWKAYADFGHADRCRLGTRSRGGRASVAAPGDGTR